MRQGAGPHAVDVVFAPDVSDADRRAYLAVPDLAPRLLIWLVWLRRALVVVALAVGLVTLTFLVIDLVSDAGSIVDEARSSGQAVDNRGEGYVGPVIWLVAAGVALYLLRQARPHLPRAAELLGRAHRQWRRRGWRDEALELADLPPRLASAMYRMEIALDGVPLRVAEQALWDSARRAVAAVTLQQAARGGGDRPDARAAQAIARRLANQVVDDADDLEAAIENGDRQWVFPPASPDAPVTLPEGPSLAERTILAERLLPG